MNPVDSDDPSVVPHAIPQALGSTRQQNGYLLTRPAWKEVPRETSAQDGIKQEEAGPSTNSNHDNVMDGQWSEIADGVPPVTGIPPVTASSVTEAPHPHSAIPHRLMEDLISDAVFGLRMTESSNISAARGTDGSAVVTLVENSPMSSQPHGINEGSSVSAGPPLETRAVVQEPVKETRDSIATFPEEIPDSKIVVPKSALVHPGSAEELGNSASASTVSDVVGSSREAL